MADHKNVCIRLTEAEYAQVSAKIEALNRIGPNTTVTGIMRFLLMTWVRKPLQAYTEGGNNV